MEVDLRDGRKTKVWAVMTLDGTACLGRVAWFGPWRKYCYFPTEKTVYEQDCLRRIAAHCEESTRIYKQAKS